MIDAHFHAWELARGDYFWLTPELTPVYRDVKISDWAQIAHQHKITGGILVQAAPTLEETQYLLEQANQNPIVKGVVGWIDMLAPDALIKLKQCAREPLLKGLRPMLQDISDPDWILQDQIQPVLHEMSELGLVLDALIKPQHIQRILKVAKRHSHLSVVIDHAAKPSIDALAFNDWATQMKQLAHETDPQQVMCKMSGIWTEAPAHSDVEIIRPWCESLLDIWTPKRIIWGSDWPVLEMAGDYSTWREFSIALMKAYPSHLKALMLGGNAQKMYRLKL